MIIIILKIELSILDYISEIFKNLYHTEDTIFSRIQLSFCSRCDYLKLDSLVNVNLFVARWKMSTLIMTDN